MKFFALGLALILPVTAIAEPLVLTLADPQPAADDVTPGLAVAYAYPNPKTLEDATEALDEGARKGSPLKGLSYEDNTEGDLVLTASSPTKVAAAISGFIRFDEAGTFNVNVISNDGIALSIGGQEVAYYDGVHACEPSGEQEVEVPEAGWYALEATYFQRKGTACLLMDWDVGGEMAPVPDEVFGHVE